MPGRHNASNAAAALSGRARARPALGRPARRARRPSPGPAVASSPRARVAGVRVFDDYAHHPTEIRATLTAARQVAGEGRLVVAFQPHRYSRTAAFRQEFGQALALADEVVVLEVYAGRRGPRARCLGRLGRGCGSAASRPGPLRAVVVGRGAGLVARAQPGDLVLTLGAGDVTMIGPEVVALLQHTPEEP